MKYTLAVICTMILAVISRSQTAELQPGNIAGTVSFSETIDHIRVSASAVDGSSSTAASFSGGTYNLIVPGGKSWRLTIEIFPTGSTNINNTRLVVFLPESIPVAVNETVTRNYSFSSTRIVGTVSVNGGTFIRFNSMSASGSVGTTTFQGISSTSETSVLSLLGVTNLNVNGSATVNNGTTNSSVSLPSQPIGAATTVSWTVTAPAASLLGTVRGNIAINGPINFTSNSFIQIDGVSRNVSANGSYELTNVTPGTWTGFSQFTFPDNSMFQLRPVATVTAGDVTTGVDFTAAFNNFAIPMSFTGILNASQVTGFLFANGPANRTLRGAFKPLTSAFLCPVPYGEWAFTSFSVSTVHATDPQYNTFLTLQRTLNPLTPVSFTAEGSTALPVLTLSTSETELIFDVVEPAGAPQETLISSPRISASAFAAPNSLFISASSSATNRAKPKLKIIGEPGTYNVSAFARVGNQDLSFGSFQLQLMPPLITPTGSNVTVQPIPGVSLTFELVTTQGNTNATELPSGPQLPHGRSPVTRGGTPVYFDIKTTALFENLVYVTLGYDATSLTAAQEAGLRLFHYDETVTPNTWVDITTSLDQVNNTITGKTSSFSLFVVAYTNPPAIGNITVPLTGRIGNSLSFNAQFTDNDLSDQHSATWTWGDGTPSSTGNVAQNTRTVAGSHVFSQRGTFTGELVVTDATNNSASKAFTVTVAGIPTAHAQAVSVMEDTAKSLTLTGVDAATYTIVSQPAHGTLSGAAPELLYTPAANYTGSDSFAFKVNDGTSDSAPATVTITVTPVNDAPTANGQSIAGPEDTPTGVTLTGTDIENDALTFAIVDAPKNGVLSGSGPNRTYTPNPNFHGPDTFTFKVNDGEFDSASAATVSLTINSVNDAPTASGQAVVTNEDVSKDIVLSGSDAENGALTYSIVTLPANGALSGTGASRVYIPNANFNGSDSFTFKVSDGVADSASATVSINVASINDAPVANVQTVSAPEDTAIGITLTGSDVDGNTLTYTVLSQPTNGVLSGTHANLVYSPATNFNGNDSFTFKTNDGVADSSSATVSISIAPVNDAPKADGQTIAIGQNVTKAIVLSGSDPEGDSLTFQILTSPVNGTLSGNGSSWSYTPRPNYIGTDSISFKAKDQSAESLAAMISITVLDTTKPVASIIELNPTPVGTQPAVLRASSSDTDGGGSNIIVLQYKIEGGPWLPFPGTLPSASQVSGAVNISGLTPGVYRIFVQGIDSANNKSDEVCGLLAIYDPTGGFTTGGGWIMSPAGAYVADPSLTGKAAFGFVSKYQKGTSLPGGETEFQFVAGGLNFQSTAYEWLVISGPLAQFKGKGTISGVGNFGFLLTAKDGQAAGGGGIDAFRIRITDNDNGSAIVYDNGVDSPIEGGSIVIHEPGKK